MRRPTHKIDKGLALCGAKERTLNYSYLIYTESDDEVTCPKCKKTVKTNLNKWFEIITGEKIERS